MKTDVEVDKLSRKIVDLLDIIEDRSDPAAVSKVIKNVTNNFLKDFGPTFTDRYTKLWSEVNQGLPEATNRYFEEKRRAAEQRDRSTIRTVRSNKK